MREPRALTPAELQWTEASIRDPAIAAEADALLVEGTDATAPIYVHDLLETIAAREVTLHDLLDAARGITQTIMSRRGYYVTMHGGSEHQTPLHCAFCRAMQAAQAVIDYHAPAPGEGRS